MQSPFEFYAHLPAVIYHFGLKFVNTMLPSTDRPYRVRAWPSGRTSNVTWILASLR